MSLARERKPDVPQRTPSPQGGHADYTLIAFLEHGIATIPSNSLLRILFALLLSTKVVHIAQDFLQAIHPLFGFLWIGCHKVQIPLFALKND